MSIEKKQSARTIEAQRFGQRLSWARERSGFESASRAHKEIARKVSINLRGYTYHEAGRSIPRDTDLINMYAELFGVSREFLLYGGGPEQHSFNHFINLGEGEPVNQLGINKKIATSEFGACMYIPIYNSRDLSFLAQNKDVPDMARDYIPVPTIIAASNEAFTWRLPETDTSMVGDSSESILPGSFLAIDPHRQIRRGEFLLCKPTNSEQPILRKLMSSITISRVAPVFPITLNAISPRVEPLRFHGSSECAILGRLIYVSKPY